ncbi:four-helix bundle copper-binding protein [Bdellovibrio bacteriovorus]
MEQKGTAFSGKHLSLLQFCADSCHLSAKLLMADVNHFHQACELTFELCSSTAAECERYEGDDIFVRCAEICRETQELCRRLAGMTVRVPFQEIPRTQTSTQASH